ncbi:acyl-CoA dehydrogenase family protein [Salicibibacter kimchii]|uniref:Acyl-CoA dehydrogenase n=1 Tax=Salicibibacter kimchii TaxID=2099786 RepID=A0A345C1U0_9BACI|nr:acyl-CoA dehydrogenase family protein [Salicibibacter kimchii]AXF57171.1 acyl-CoA dehydrogenase [Salicibibacter kimchii]
MEALNELLKENLKPIVNKIDTDAYYPKEILQLLGDHGYFHSGLLPYEETVRREVKVVEEISKFCMTTGFNVWCHLAALTYVRHTSNKAFQSRLLPELEQGHTIAGTGLSNPMKHYADLEPIHLDAESVHGGYMLSGTLPAVSNLRDGHWFGAVAKVHDDKRIMVFINCNDEDIDRKEKKAYLGLNGSATYACRLDQLFIPDDQVLAEDADAFISSVRPYFLVYQIPLGFGVIQASLRSIDMAKKKQGGCNDYLPIQSEDLEKPLEKMQHSLEQLFKDQKSLEWNDLLPIRRDAAYEAINAAHTAMVHVGGPGYMHNSAPSRRLREAYFLINLTPTIRHLEKMIELNKEPVLQY